MWEWLLYATTVSIMSELLKGEDCNIIKPTAPETGTILFLHGLGDTGFGYPSYLEGCQLPHVKIIAPTTSVKPVTVNRGYKMPSWFDVYELKNNEEKVDEASLKMATKDIHEALKEIESTGTPSNRIILGGISQGGCLALYAAVTYERPLAGILLLSTWLPLKDKVHKDVQETNKLTPILQCHGEADPLIIYKSAEEVAEFFKSQDFKNHTLKGYPGLVHTIGIPQELDDIKQWILKVLP